MYIPFLQRDTRRNISIEAASSSSSAGSIVEMINVGDGDLEERARGGRGEIEGEIEGRMDGGREGER